MEDFLFIINVILAILLVGIILLQRSEGGALGLGASQDTFVSTRSVGNFLTKSTAIIATLFIITSISLTVFSNQQLPTQSILEKIEQNQDPSEPQIPKSE
jgi:preprotein translocase subunit SecG